MTENQNLKKVGTTVLAPHVRKHAEVVLAQPYLGLCRREVEIMNPKPSIATFSDESDCDRFQLIIPYAGMKIECMVIFQSSAPECPPDFIFSDSRFFAPINQIEALSSWDVRKSDGLLLVLKEILQFYKKKQIQELERYEHLNFEYLCLFQLQNFNEEDIEILVPPEPESPIIFLIRLHVDFANIFPDFYEEDSDFEDYPLLLVFFPNRESSRSCQRLYLSKKAQSIITVDEHFKLTDAVDSNYLTRYIIALETELKIKSELAATRYAKRKRYVTTFLTHLNQCIVEYDMTMTTLTFLLKHEEFYFILEITLPDDFPMVPPALLFRSIYHYCNGAPFATSVDNYPYSPNWPIQKVLRETIKFIEEYAPLFQQDSSSVS